MAQIPKKITIIVSKFSVEQSWTDQFVHVNDCAILIRVYRLYLKLLAAGLVEGEFQKKIRATIVTLLSYFSNFLTQNHTVSNARCNLW